MQTVSRILSYQILVIHILVLPLFLATGASLVTVSESLSIDSPPQMHFHSFCVVRLSVHLHFALPQTQLQQNPVDYASLELTW